MRLLLVLGFVALAAAGSMRPMSDKIDNYVIDLVENDGDIEVVIDNEEGTMAPAPQFILSWQARRMIRKLQKQMPCGWPDLGIPPLAPVRVSEAEFSIKRGILETFERVFRFKVAGLDDFKINKFKLNMILSKVTFDFTFNNILATAQHYETNTLIDALKQLGLSVQYEGDGTLLFGLTKLRITGTLKYKIPILWGSMKITSLKTKISLEKCTSEIDGFMGNGSINRMINRQIENFVEMGINNNQQEISDMIEDTLVPKVNKMLKGNDFWTLIDMIFGGSSDEKEDDPIVVKCVPPADPWA